MDHDQNFKNLIVDCPHDAIAFFAASAAAGIDAGARVTPIRQEQLKAHLGERFRELDVPHLVEWPDGRREAILFVIEEEGLQKGLQKGLEQGLEQGRQKRTHDGAAGVLIWLLARRFGDEAAASVRGRLDAADLDEVMAWSDRILTADSLEEVFR